MKCRIVVKGVFEWTAQTEEELTYKEGDILLITDDSDPDWWMAFEKKIDTFQECRSGLVPVSYVEEATPLFKTKALYDYDPQTEDEIAIREGDLVKVYEMVDNDWWFAKQDDNVGLVPATYLETLNDEPAVQSAPIANPADSGTDAQAQKQLLMSALGGLGFAQPKTAHTEPKGQIYGPDDITYYVVTELDKKKRKNSRKGLLGVSYEEQILYFLDFETREIISKHSLSEITKNKDKKTIIKLEFGKDNVKEYEGEKADIKALHEAISNPQQTSGKNSTNATSELKVAVVPATQITPTYSPSIISTRSPAPSQRYAVALYDYSPLDEGEIAIREDDKLLVLDDSDPDWCLVKLVSNNTEGLVPRTYIEIRENAAQNESTRSSSNAREMKQREQQAEIERIQREQELAEQQRIQRQQEQERLQRQREEELEQQQKREEQIRMQRQRDEQEKLQRQREEERRRRDEIEKSQRQKEEEQRRLELERKQQEEERRRREETARNTAPVIPNRPARSSVTKTAPESIPQVPARPDAPVKRPSIPSRPAVEATPAPPAIPVIPGRPNAKPAIPNRPADPKVSVKPEMPSRPASRPVKEDTKKADTSSFPDPSSLRQWTDKTGTFQVDAAYLGISGNKVHLHKVNGVKIFVPLEKLDSRDLEYLRKLPGNESLSIQTASIPVPQPKSKNTTNSNPVNFAECTYNGFDWREWLIKSGVSSQDAVTYGKKFAEQKMDQSILSDIDRETLRAMAISEGDIIRIRKAANLPSISPKVAGKLLAKEKEAEQKNLNSLLSRKSTAKQIAEDEMLARQLQNQENTRNQSHINSAVLKQAGNILQGSHGSSNNPTSSAFNSQVRLQNLSQTSSSGLSKNGGSEVLNNDPWSTKNFEDSQKLKQEETAKQLAAAQEAMKKAQEQAKQAQLLEQKTMAMKLQQQQNEAALAQAQETARKAMLMQQQAEQALFNAQKNAQAATQQSAPMSFTAINPAMPPASFASQPLAQQSMNVRPISSMNVRPMANNVMPVQPMMNPLIPTPPAAAPIGGFVPLPGSQPKLAGNMNQTAVPTMVGSSGVVKPQWSSATPNQPFGNADKYSAFKEAAPNAPSVFNTPAPLSSIPTGSSINPSSSVSYQAVNQGQFQMMPQMAPPSRAPVGMGNMNPGGINPQFSQMGYNNQMTPMNMQGASGSMNMPGLGGSMGMQPGMRPVSNMQPGIPQNGYNGSNFSNYSGNTSFSGFAGQMNMQQPLNVQQQMNMQQPLNVQQQQMNMQRPLNVQQQQMNMQQQQMNMNRNTHQYGNSFQ